MASIWSSRWQLQFPPIQPLWSSGSAPSASANHLPPWWTPPKHGTHAHRQTQSVDFWRMCRGEAIAVGTVSMFVIAARGRRAAQHRQISLNATEEMRALRAQVEALRSELLSLQSDSQHGSSQQQPERPRTNQGALREDPCEAVTEEQSAALEAILHSEARADQLMQELAAEDHRAKELTAKLEALIVEQDELRSSSIDQVENEAKAHSLVEELEAQEEKAGTLKEALEEEVEELADEAEHLKDKALLDASLTKVHEVEPPQDSLPEDELVRDIALLKAELADAEAVRLALKKGATEQQPKHEQNATEKREGGKQEQVEKQTDAGATAGEVQAEATAGVAQTEASPSAVAARLVNDHTQQQEQQQKWHNDIALHRPAAKTLSGSATSPASRTDTVTLHEAAAKRQEQQDSILAGELMEPDQRERVTGKLGYLEDADVTEVKALRQQLVELKGELGTARGEIGRLTALVQRRNRELAEAEAALLDVQKFLCRKRRG